MQTSNAARFLRWFSLLFVALNVCIIALAVLPLPVKDGPFGSTLGTYQPDVRTTLRMKLAYAAARPTFDVALFGNSRSVAVSTADIGLSDGAFFNFSVGGTSFEQSVRMLQHLASADRAPNVALISLDHAELQFFNHAMEPVPIAWPAHLLGQPVRVMQSGLDAEFSPANSLRATLGVLVHAWQETENMWAVERVTGTLSYLITSDSRPVENEDAAPFEQDGSVPYTFARSDDPSIMPDVAPLADYGLIHMVHSARLLGDLARDHGITVIVFESPVSPQVGARIHADPTDAALRLREAVFSECETAAITCLSAPLDLPNAENARWPDCCHAPAAALGAYLRDVLRQHSSETLQ